MTERRVVVHIGEVVIEAEHGDNLAALEAEVRAGIAESFRSGTPAAFERNAALLAGAHSGILGIGGAIAHASAPRRDR
jgi:hypothetical protein